jgi:hypothetical protein
MNNLWERGLQRNYLCGCGAHFSDCLFWAKVGQAAFGGWSELEASEILALKRDVMRYRRLPWLLGPGVSPALLAKTTAYREYTARVYAAIAGVSGARVVVDNSHEAMGAVLLRDMPGVRGHIIHLVRDSRAVAFSLSRRVLRGEANDTATYMPRYSSLPAAVEWVAGNLPYHFIPPSSIPRLRVRYESLVAAPSTVLAQVAEFLGSQLPDRELSHFDHESIELGENHMISGNPHRLGRRSMRIRLDDEWKTAMRPLDRVLVTSVTGPLNATYGYLGVGDGGRVQRTTLTRQA